jgi:hypothetical protein
MAASGYALPKDRANGYNNLKIAEGGYRIHPEQAAAGLWSTPSDLARFAIAMQHSLGGKRGAMLDKAMAEAAVAPVLRGYALGFEVAPDGDGVRFGHDGINFGFESKFVAHSSNGRAIVVMTNGQGGQLLANELVSTIADAEGWQTLGVRRVEEIALDAKALADFSGYFAGPGFRIGIDDTTGRLKLNANGEEVGEFLPIGEDRLVFAALGLTLQAERDVNGRVMALMVIDGPPLRLERTGNPIDAIGSVPMFVRGTMNDWGLATPLVPVDGGWAAELELPTGAHMFKLASEDWATIDLGAVGGVGTVEPGGAIGLAAGGANIGLNMPNPGRLRIVLDTSDRLKPLVRVETLP